jgi:divinyl chlorophyllide a 8-vinyl-reductase
MSLRDASAQPARTCASRHLVLIGRPVPGRADGGRAWAKCATDSLLVLPAGPGYAAAMAVEFHSTPAIKKPQSRVFVAGATGYIGRFVVHELVARGYEVVAFARDRTGIEGAGDRARIERDLPGAQVRFGDICEPGSLREAGFKGENFDFTVSCLGSRTGGVEDAWRVEHQANCQLLEASREAGVRHFVLLSAICVQKPLLAFQRAKLAFEEALVESDLCWSIVRPTAFFKSLSGQVGNVKRGRPFLMFGDGQLTRCKPISEADLAIFIADCLVDSQRVNRVLPIGGPGAPITPRQQAQILFALCNRPERCRQVPVALFDIVIAGLGGLARLIPALQDKVEFARIGRYYATESMLWLDPATGEYDAEATPSWGTDTLEDFYRRVISEGLDGQELGDHALFDRGRH